jgi:flavin-binding protein dodecin
VDAAIRNGIRRASRTLRNLDWFEVTQVRGEIVDGEIEHYQVGLKVGFRLEEPDAG